MRKKTKIECSPEVRELNESIETADLLTDYQWDRFTGEQVASALENSGCPYHAADLRNKLAAVERPDNRYALAAIIKE